MSVQVKPQQRQKRITKDAISYLIMNTNVRKCQPAVQKVAKNKRQCRTANTKQQCQSKRTTKQVTQVFPKQGTQLYNQYYDICTEKMYKFQSLPCTWKQPVIGKNYCTFSIDSLLKRKPKQTGGGYPILEHYERDMLENLLDDYYNNSLEGNLYYPRVHAKRDIEIRKDYCKKIPIDKCQSNSAKGYGRYPSKLPCSIKKSMLGKPYCTLSVSSLADHYFPDKFKPVSSNQRGLF